MDVLVERCAGLDVHRDTVVATVRLPAEGGGGKQREQETRTFTTTTAGIRALSDWLAGNRVTRVGLESTGVYWKPVYYLLEEAVECWLLNPHHLKVVPGARATSRTRRGSPSWLSTGWCGPVSSRPSRSASCGI